MKAKGAAETVPHSTFRVQPMPIFELSVVPIGTASSSVSRYVQAAVRLIRESGLDCSVGAMGTCVQGEWDRVFALVKEIHEALVRMGCKRILTTLKVDDRRDRAQTLQSKVKRALGRD